MAAGFVDDEGRRRSGSGRVTAFVALSCATAAMGGAIYGYDISIAGGVSSMEPFLRDFFPGVLRRMAGGGGGADGGAPRVSNYCKFDSQLLTLFTSSLYISGLLTAVLLASWVTASRGRRASMILGGFAYIAGAAVSGAAVNVSMAILGRALLGVGLGFTTQSVPLYMAEMAPARYRGAFSNGIQFSLCLGALAATTVNFAVEKIRGGWGWRLSLALAGVPAVFLTVGAVFLPETPNSLVQQGKDRDTVKALLQRIRGVDAVDDELDEIVAANAAAAAAHGENGLWLILSRRRYRPQLAMAVLIPAFTQLTGINAIGFYLPVLRALLLAGGAQMLVSEALIGSIMAAKLGDEGAPSKAYATLLVVLIGVYSTGFGWSWGPLSWLVPTEVLPLEVRSAGQSVAVATCFALTVLVAQCFLAALCRMKAWIFFFFAGWIAAMTAFVYFFLPETKGIPIEQVGSVWEEHWFWRRIAGTDEIHASSKLSK
ncbi:hypothetical protein OsI_14928 [Oryza sativa Indica Group]|uniref:Major facilitator superfamily (MFS) profile domain-containing protein n=1 Tax=Oryza sativa subsp. indica TaxID=39946 RepID=B8AVE3_ORYSI|nr:hypothetical protein OsI_14928 [Oryza sativa Indica Group]